jgi:hypothetical protein
LKRGGDGGIGWGRGNGCSGRERLLRVEKANREKGYGGDT